MTDIVKLNVSGFDADFGCLISSVLDRKLSERGIFASDNNLKISISLDVSTREDAYSVSCADKANVKITAGGKSGAFAALGAYLRHCNFDGNGGFVPASGSFSLTPEREIHGIYFATHFGNFYEAAPIEEIYTLLEDLALYGCNALMIWYDMHQYSSINDAKSVSMISRLKKICTCAGKLGMKTVYISLANESFNSSDPKIRAEWQIQNGYKSSPDGHYHVEICPNKDGGLEEILNQRKQVIEAFADVPMDYICIWPYDQGGCTCEKCAPWGVNGYIKCAKAVEKLCRECRPSVKIMLSTWYFDKFVDGEWDKFIEIIESHELDSFSNLIGYLFNNQYVPEKFRKKYAKEMSMLSFPEISMHHATPWGGYGANPMPVWLGENFAENKGIYFGSLPYSEGVFEDMNKVMMLSFYSGRSEDTRKILEEYAGFEFGLYGGDAKKFVDMVYAMETSLKREEGDGIENKWWSFLTCPYDKLVIDIEDKSEVENIAKAAEELDSLVPEKLRNSYRWKQIYIRALSDAELVLHGGHPTEKYDEYMNELTRMYYAQNSDSVVSPASRERYDATHKINK